MPEAVRGWEALVKTIDFGAGWETTMGANGFTFRREREVYRLESPQAKHYKKLETQ